MASLAERFESIPEEIKEMIIIETFREKQPLRSDYFRYIFHGHDQNTVWHTILHFPYLPRLRYLPYALEINECCLYALHEYGQQFDSAAARGELLPNWRDWIRSARVNLSVSLHYPLKPEEVCATLKTYPKLRSLWISIELPSIEDLVLWRLMVRMMELAKELSNYIEAPMLEVVKLKLWTCSFSHPSRQEVEELAASLMNDLQLQMKEQGMSTRVELTK